MSKPAETAPHEFSEDGIRRINVSYTNETVERKKTEWREFVNDLGPYSGNYCGKGIVICAGGLEYFTCAWVNIKVLRKSGCKLPVELWHQDGELNSEAMSELGKLDVTCRNFADYSEVYISNGYQLNLWLSCTAAFRKYFFWMPTITLCGIRASSLMIRITKTPVPSFGPTTGKPKDQFPSGRSWEAMNTIFRSRKADRYSSIRKSAGERSISASSSILPLLLQHPLGG